MVGRAIEYYPRVLLALVRLGRLGLAPDRVSLSLAKVRDETAMANQEVESSGAGLVMPQRVMVPIELGPPDPRDLHVTLHTPLRLVSDDAGGWVALEVGEVRRGSIRLDEVVAPLGVRPAWSESASS